MRQKRVGIEKENVDIENEKVYIEEEKVDIVKKTDETCGCALSLLASQAASLSPPSKKYCICAPPPSYYIVCVKIKPSLLVMRKFTIFPFQ